MPIIRPNLDGGGSEKRTTFRPPWVKDGPSPLPCPPSNPWLQQAKQAKEVKNTQPPPSSVLKKPKEKEVKIQVAIDKDKELSKPKEREVKINIEKEKNHLVSAEKNKDKNSSTAKKPEKPHDGRVKNIEVARDGREPQTKGVEIKVIPEEKKMEPVPPTSSKAPLPPAPPPPPPCAPPLPPPMKGSIERKPLTKEKAMKLEALRSRPRRRPDWTDMMKEVEKGIKLNHVKCNDRSAPVLPMAKAKGQFVYDSEKHTAHNQLLKEIQSGVHLKKVKTNDRSKPVLEGLRKFRRQMTIEEIITKSASVADVVAVASQPDELDDIDKVRDDLQSTKQMLALELRNKEALERENKRLMARLVNLEAELEKEKSSRTVQDQGNTKLTRTAEDDKLINKLKEEASESAKMTKEMEDKYHKTAEELDLTRAKLESAWLKNAQLEIEIKSKGNFRAPLTKQQSAKRIPASDKKSQSSVQVNKIQEDSDTVTESETEDEEDEIEDSTEVSTATQEARELKLLTNKLKTLKDKKSVANSEKKSLKSQLTRLNNILKDEKKKYKVLQNEVEKMASIMKDVEGDEEDDEEPEDDEEDEDEEESESETESEEQYDSEGDLPDTASHQEKVKNLNRRIKSHETMLTRAKKGNYLLKANIDRKQDDVNRQKEMSLALQEDLDAVLSELG